MELKTYRINDLVEKIIDNRGRNPDKYYDYENIPVIDNYLIKGELHPNLNRVNRYLSLEQYENFLRGYIEEDDLLITLVGNGYGSCTLVPNHICAIVQNTIGLRINNNASSKFLFYYFLQIKDAIKNLDRGSAQPSVNRKDFLNLKIKMPNIDTQNAISDILIKYDYLIENNNRRIIILEQMAEKIYKNLFAYHKIKNNSYEIKLGDILNMQRGISYSSEEIDCDDGNNLINLKNIKAYGGFRRDGTKKYDGKYKESQIVNSGNLIMGVTDMTQDRRTVGSVALIPTIDGISVISADLVKIDSKIDNTFLYAMFKYGNLSKYISQFANGANVLHLKPQAISNIKVQLPNKNLINRYVEIVKPIIEEIDKLNLQNDNLMKQRDLLLPRLMSGKLEIK